MIRFHEIIGIIFLMTMLVCVPASAADKKSKVKADDYIGMAAMLVKDGLYQRALMALENVDVNSEEVDLMRFYTLQGLAFLSLNDLSSAKNSLEKSVSNGQTDPVIYIYLAQSYYGLKEYQNTIDAVNKAETVSADYPGIVEMQAQSYWLLKNYDQAIAVINKAEQQHPEDYRFLRRKVFYLVELGLYRNAAENGLIYLQNSNAQAKDYIAIGNALRLSHQFAEALQILEVAYLKFPDDATVAKVLAHTYLDQGQLNTAAQIFERGAEYDASLFAEAGEIYRRAGRFYHALLVNAKIPDQKVKLKQRLALLLALNRYEAAANMDNVLYRHGLIEEESIRYALAYAYFNIGQYAKSKRNLDYLKDPELFKKGIELRRIMTECEANPLQCV
ncbi:MAG: tetratricopeptide repeat protein [Methyloprofundus sp.]|nr:tetratricopeptide repeat protein [Methyloprofundus sp.]MDT8426244.1 tetratricopeptide repeat protein [Methyloprofundus sp.]